MNSNLAVGSVAIAVIITFIGGALNGPYVLPWIDSIMFPNSPPHFTSLSADPESPAPVGLEIDFTAKASDADNDILVYNFLLKNANTGSILKKRGWNSDRSWTWDATESNSGSYIIEAWVRDGHHATKVDESDDQSAIEYKIAENSPPHFTSLSADPENSAPAGSRIEWIASASDPDNDDLSYNFIIKNASTGSILEKRGWDSDSDFTWFTTESNSGSYIIEAWVRDGHHAIKVDESDDQSTDTYTLLNGRPISINNQCSKKIKLILRYNSPLKGWTTDGIWELEPQSPTYLTTEENNYEYIRIKDKYLYYYAYLSDNSNYNWSGNYSWEFGGKSYGMRYLSPFINYNGDYELTFTCPNINASN